MNKKSKSNDDSEAKHLGFDAGSLNETRAYGSNCDLESVYLLTPTWEMLLFQNHG